jgi:dTDP-4-amino-4,6-dideoxygalactose transaminase
MYRSGQEEVDAATRVILARQWFRVGEAKDGHLGEVDHFEREWAEKLGVPYALLMNGGGTGALLCALAGAEIGPGDEVIVPAYTWLASATSVLAAGAIPVLADVDETLGLDPEDFERKIGPATKAVIPVHMSGRPANLEAIIAIARKRGLKVIEDSCQMDGGSYKGRRTGTWGDAGAFSFNFFKIISCGGEGGCMVTSDRKIYERAFVFHDSGAAFRPKASELREPVFVSQQYRADEFMGAIARVQMRRLDGILADLRRMRDTLAAAVAGSKKVAVAPGNDPEGDCGVMLTLQFANEAAARAFATAPGINGLVVIDHGKHIYTNWAPLREKRISHHPDMNPFFFQKNKGLRMDYSDSACPRTLEILRRTVYIACNPDWTPGQLQTLASALQTASRSL